jgi:heme A synthase
MVPDAQTAKTWIEYAHRVTSGICGILGLGMLGWAWRRYGPGHRVFRGAVATFIFLIIESLIGALLVKAELVASNASAARAAVVSLHLVNTMGLSGAAVLTAWWATGGRTPTLSTWTRTHTLAALILAGLVVTSMAGAVTALGDTLFPIDPTIQDGLFAKIRDGLSPTNHFLVRLRILHPLLAVLVSVLISIVVAILRSGTDDPRVRGLSLVVLTTVGIQFIVGFANIALGAPGWMQIVHLLLAQVLWLAALLFAVEATAFDLDANPATP